MAHTSYRLQETAVGMCRSCNAALREGEKDLTSIGILEPASPASCAGIVRTSLGTILGPRGWLFPRCCALIRPTTR